MSQISRVVPSPRPARRPPRAAHAGDLAHARACQLASDEVLELISASGTDIRRILEKVVSSAARLCHAEWGIIRQRRGDGLFPPVATYAIQPDILAFISENPIAPGHASAASRALLERRTVHVPDILDEADYTWGKGEKGFGHRSVLAVPLLRGNEPLGVFSLVRNAMQPFSPDEIALVTSFAGKALIAIENAELILQVQTRTDELQESLAYQTAIGDVLNVISQAPADLQSVFDAIVQTAARLCRAEWAVLFRLSEGRYHLAAANNAQAELVQYARRHPGALGRDTMIGRVAIERRTIHMPDCLADPEYGAFEYQRVGRFRSMLGVPLLRGGMAIGVIGLMRNCVDPFTAKQMDVVNVFAEQAVIAIENARLFEELQHRTAELTDALEQQTATADVLQVISRSKFDLVPVLRAIVESANRLCEADGATIWRPDEGRYVAAASAGARTDFTEMLERIRLRPEGRSIVAMALRSGDVIHIPDIVTDPHYADMHPRIFGGFRSHLAVPILGDEGPLGVLAIGRTTPSPFTGRQIELITTFADQAAIAIENVRLFNERAEALERQTATAEILRVIASARSDVQPVFDVIADSTMRLMKCWSMLLTTFDGEYQRFGAARGALPDSEAFIRSRFPVKPGWDLLSGRCILQREPINTPDAWEDASPAVRDQAMARGYRATLCVPMMLGGACIGTISTSRKTPGAFADEDVATLKTFADQA